MYIRIYNYIFVTLGVRLLENIFFAFREISTISKTDLRRAGKLFYTVAAFSITEKLKIGFSRADSGGVKSLAHQRALKTHFQSSRIET